MRKHRFLGIFLLLLVFLMAGCDSGNRPYTPTASVDWSMTAHLITADGTVEQSFPITVQGSVNEARLYLDIELPNDFRYRFSDPDSDGSATIKYGLEQPGDLCTALFTYDCEANEPAASYYAINTEKEYFLACFDNSDGYYLVAATDPDVDGLTVTEHFDSLIQKVIVPWWQRNAKQA